MNLSFGRFSANLQFLAAWAFLGPMWRRRIFISTFSFALAALFVAGCSSNSANIFQGYIEGEYVYVASPLGGALTNLAVARGDEVKTGQLLFELERGSEAAAVQQAEKNLAQAKANLALSEAEYARRQQLRNDQGVISAEELDQTRAQRDADQAQVESQTAALDKARWSFDQKQQFAPANALVQDTLYRAGEWVAAGNPVVELLPPANIKVRFFVPQAAVAANQARSNGQCDLRRRPARLFGHGQLHFHAGRVHAAGDLQPREPLQTRFHDRGKIFSGRCGRPSPRPAGGCGVAG